MSFAMRLGAACRRYRSDSGYRANHSAEIDLEGPTVSLRGIDNRSYYWVREDGDYHNWTGAEYAQLDTARRGGVGAPVVAFSGG